MGEVETIREREHMLVVMVRWLNEYVEPVDSFMFEPSSPIPETIATRLMTMPKADYVVFAKGWETDQLCEIEMMCAKMWGANIIDFNEDKTEAMINGE